MTSLGPSHLYVLVFALIMVGCGDSPLSQGAPQDAGAPDGDIAGEDGDIAGEEPEGRQCNGASLLCERSYDTIAYPTTHNGMSSEEDGWWVPNQLLNLSHQLEDGVRAFMLDVYRWEGDLYLCHGACEIGAERYVDALARFADFLADHPDEVITFIFESYVEAVDHRAAFEESGLLPMVYAHPAGAPWPTLAAMIDDDRRVVAFTDDDEGVYDWLMPVWDHAVETDWNNTDITDLDCRRGRGADGNALLILNHFVRNAPPLDVALASIAEVVNRNPFFLETARACEAARGQLPSFVTVDFYSIGDLFAVVDALNGL